MGALGALRAVRNRFVQRKLDLTAVFLAQLHSAGIKPPFDLLGGPATDDGAGDPGTDSARDRQGRKVRPPERHLKKAAVCATASRATRPMSNPSASRARFRSKPTNASVLS